MRRRRSKIRPRRIWVWSHLTTLLLKRTKTATEATVTLREEPMETGIKEVSVEVVAAEEAEVAVEDVAEAVIEEAVTIVGVTAATIEVLAEVEVDRHSVVRTEEEETTEEAVIAEGAEVDHRLVVIGVAITGEVEIAEEVEIADEAEADHRSVVIGVETTGEVVTIEEVVVSRLKGFIRVVTEDDHDSIDRKQRYNDFFIIVMYMNMIYFFK